MSLVLMTVGPVPDGLSMLILLTLAGAGSLAVLGLAVAALARRRSRSYLLVALAFGTLAARTAVAGLTLMQLVSPMTHHLLEHGLDVIMAGLVIAAVYYARTVTQTQYPHQSGYSHD